MIVVIGSINMDLVASVPHHPAPGETILAFDYARHHGGKGANQAVAAARVGADVSMIGAVGSDVFGDQLVDELKGEKINVGAINRADCSSGLALISIDRHGENRIIVVAGANAALTPQTIVPRALAGATVALLQLEIPLPSVRYAAEMARAAGATVVLNAAPATQIDINDLVGIDWLVVNAGEAAHLLKTSPAENIEEAQSQANALFGTGLKTLITLGAEGVVWRDSAGTGHFPALSTPVIDTTAAGDAFAGVFAQSLDAGWPIRDCVERANIAGALAVANPGARNSLPNAEQLNSRIVAERRNEK